MRRIDLNLFQPSDAWLAKAAAAFATLESKETATERTAFIKANSSIWRELREELIARFGNKCWFTDAPEYVARLDVEHFRPKAAALNRKGVKRGGYWWLAFDWQNYRLCGQIPNRERKKCWFPLMPSSFVATGPQDNWQLELPAFLDPKNPTDVDLVAYAEDGLLHAKPGANLRERYRVKITEELLGLSQIPLVVEERRRLWKDCRLLIHDYMRLKEREKRCGRDPVLASEQDNVLRQIIALAESNKPFASVIRNCLRLAPEEWAKGILALVN
jgi:hypothetical protein